jgi:hypothetical protein
VLFAADYKTEVDRMEHCLALLKQKWTQTNQKLDQFSADMRSWRINRRSWELDLIMDEWCFGQMKCLPAKFTLNDIINAKISMLK